MYSPVPNYFAKLHFILLTQQTHLVWTSAFSDTQVSPAFNRESVCTCMCVRTGVYVYIYVCVYISIYLGVCMRVYL